MMMAGFDSICHSRWSEISREKRVNESSESNRRNQLGFDFGRCHFFFRLSQNQARK